MQPESKVLFRLFVLSAVSLAAWSPAAAGEKAAVGARSGGGATSEVYQVDLSTGFASGWELRSGGLRLDPITVQQNLFEAIGRPVGPAAPRGSIFLFSINENGGSTKSLAILEADSGYVGFLNRVGKDRKVGELLGAVGRPGSAAAAADGLHALIPAATSNSATSGFYIVHGGSGACVWMSEFDSSRAAANAESCSALPVAAHGWAGVPMRAQAPTFTLLDVATGTAYLVRSTTRPGELIARPIAIDLGAAFGQAAEGAPERRYSAAEVWTSAGNGMVVADAASGRLALVSGLDAPTPQISSITGTFERASGVSDPRAVLVPVYGGNGATSGILVFEATGTPLSLITDLDSGALRTQPVEIRR